MCNKQQRKSETCFTKVSSRNILWKCNITNGNCFLSRFEDFIQKSYFLTFHSIASKTFLFSNRQYCSGKFSLFCKVLLNILKSYNKLLVVCDIQFYKLLYEKESVMNYYAHLHCDNYFNFCVHLRILLLTVYKWIKKY